MAIRTSSTPIIYSITLVALLTGSSAIQSSPLFTSSPSSKCFSGLTAFSCHPCNNKNNARIQRQRQQLCYRQAALSPQNEEDRNKWNSNIQNTKNTKYNYKLPKQLSNTIIQQDTKTSTTENKDNDIQNPSSYPFLSIVAPLLLISVSNQWSRSSLYYLVDFSPETLAISSTSSNNFDAYAHAFMNVDLHFTAEQYGFLASAAFTSLFALTSLYAGKMADTHDRRLLLTCSCFAWSMASIGMAFSHSYQDVLILRSLSGLACAFAAPSSYTLLRDLVSKKMAGSASATYGSGVYLGEAMASLSILTGGGGGVSGVALGWRGALAVTGMCGVFCAALIGLVLPEDTFGDRGSASAATTDVNERLGKTSTKFSTKATSSSSSTILSDASTVLSTSNRICFLFLAVFFRFCAGLTIGIWSAPYFRLAFPNDASSYAIANAMIVGVCGVASGMIGGWMSDKLAEQAEDESTGRLLVPILGAFLAIPIWHMTLHATTFEGAMFWLAMKYLVAECWFGPAVAVLQSDVPSKYGGTAQGMFTLTGAMGNLAPSLMGVLFCWTMDESVRGDGIGGMIAKSVAIAAGGDEQLMLGTLLDSVVGWAYLFSGACFMICALSNMAGRPAAGMRTGNELLLENKNLQKAYVPVRVTNKERNYVDDSRF